MTKLAETIWKSGCLETGDSVVVGFSGGADSLALLAGLMELAPQKKLAVTACHVHHGIRGEEADQDAAASEQMAKRLGASFCLVKVDAPAYAKAHGLGLEEAARILRYEAFSNVAQSMEAANIAATKDPNGADTSTVKRTVKVATAHTKSDYAETVLMRILRGTGPDGLAAMTTVSAWPFAGSAEPKPKLLLIRPLLAVTAEETRSFCDALGMIPRKDSTNNDTTYLRNRVRLELLPQLKTEYNPAIEDALVRLGTLAGEAKSLLDDMTDEAFLTVLRGSKGAENRKQTKCAEVAESAENIKCAADNMQLLGEPGISAQSICLDRRKLLTLSPTLAKRVLARGLREIGMEKDLSLVTLDSAYRLLATGKGAGEAEFAGNYRMKLAHESVILYGAFTKRE